MDPKDGGRAFPNDGLWANGFPEGGMSLRDWFAGQALAGISARDDYYVPSGGDYNKQVAEEAYGLADAMLAERAKATVDQAMPTEG